MPWAWHFQGLTKTVIWLENVNGSYILLGSEFIYLTYMLRLALAREKPMQLGILKFQKLHVHSNHVKQKRTLSRPIGRGFAQTPLSSSKRFYTPPSNTFKYPTVCNLSTSLAAIENHCRQIKFGCTTCSLLRWIRNAYILTPPLQWKWRTKWMWINKWPFSGTWEVVLFADNEAATEQPGPLIRPLFFNYFLYTK